MRTRGSVCISSAAGGGTNEQASPVADQLEGEQLTHWKSAVEQVWPNDSTAYKLRRSIWSHIIVAFVVLLLHTVSIGSSSARYRNMTSDVVPHALPEGYINY